MPPDTPSESVTYGLRPGRVASVVREFAEAAQSQPERDHKLWIAIDLLLTEMAADGLVFCPGEDAQVFSAFKPYLEFTRKKKKKLVAGVRELVKARAGQENYYLVGQLNPDELQILFCFPKADPGKHCYHFFAFLKFGGVPRGQSYARWRKITYIPPGDPGFAIDKIDLFETYCRAVQMAFSRRAEREQMLPPKLSRLIWDEIDDQKQTDRALRPWDTKAQVWPSLTATLNFDIRKSTFAMESVIDSAAYAAWIDGVLQVLRRLVHDNGGIFDKFTGDGVLAHFPPVSARLTKRLAADLSDESQVSELALTCACEMVQAFDIYSRFLIPSLSVVGSDFGGAIGLALDKASWSIDSMGAPIVVGRGVVHACRASTGAAGTIKATNAFRYATAHILPRHRVWKDTDFVTKEYPEAAAVRIARLALPPKILGRDRERLRQLCEEVKAMVQKARYDINHEREG